VIDDGNRKLDIYRLARSLAALIHTVTLSATSWPQESSLSLRRSSKLLISKILDADHQKSNRHDFAHALGEASALASEILAQLASPEAFSNVPKSERTHLLSSYRGLLELLHASMGSTPEKQGFPFSSSDQAIQRLSAEGRIDPQCLKDKVVLITRPLPQSLTVVEAVERHGGLPAIVPMVEIVEPDDWDPVDKSIINLRRYDGVIFTNQNGVEQFIDRIMAIDTSAKRILASRRNFAVGEKTRARLESALIPATLMPGHLSEGDLVTALKKEPLAGKRFLFAGGSQDTKEFPEALRTSGAIVDEIELYRTIGPSESSFEPLKQALARGEIDIITFFSPSSVQHFSQSVGSELTGKRLVACIGPSTADAATSAGFHTIITAREATAESLIGALVDFLEQ
jgi:uroporphyrinogen-III synthase